MRQYKARRDVNEAHIVRYLRKLGMDVKPISMPAIPDLLIGANFFGFKQNLLFEVKSAKGTLTQSQMLFFLTWSGQRCVVRSIQDIKEFLRVPVIRVYKCENCGMYEVKQRIYEEPFTLCVTCKEPIKIVYHAIPMHFMGSGWGGKTDVQPKSNRS